MILKYVKLMIICLLTLVAQDVNAATMHAVLIGDTSDAKLGTAMGKNLDRMEKELKHVSHVTKLELDLILIRGYQTHMINIAQQIQRLNVAKDDVVVIYFSMHGYRTRYKTNPWPNLFFGHDSAGVDMDNFNKAIEKKEPRLLLAMADSCNNYAEGYIPTFMPLMAEPLDDPKPVPAGRENANYRKLFLEHSGTMIVSASQPGQFAWGSRNMGTILTSVFLESLQTTVKNEDDINWYDVFAHVSMGVERTVKMYGINEPQVPQYHLDIVRNPQLTSR